MADLSNVIRLTNIFLGFSTIVMGFLVLIVYVLNFRFSFNGIPSLLMPFFMALLGVLVLSNQFDFPAIKENCGFLSHKVGVVMFFVYLGVLMGYFSNTLEKISGLLRLVGIICSLGYIVLAVLLGLISCFGEEKVSNTADKVTEKITKD